MTVFCPWIHAVQFPIHNSIENHGASASRNHRQQNKQKQSPTGPAIFRRRRHNHRRQSKRQGKNSVRKLNHLRPVSQCGNPLKQHPANILGCPPSGFQGFSNRRDERSLPQRNFIISDCTCFYLFHVFVTQSRFSIILRVNGTFDSLSFSTVFLVGWRSLFFFRACHFSRRFPACCSYCRFSGLLAFSMFACFLSSLLSCLLWRPFQAVLKDFLASQSLYLATGIFLSFSLLESFFEKSCLPFENRYFLRL